MTRSTDIDELLRRGDPAATTGVWPAGRIDAFVDETVTDPVVGDDAVGEVTHLRTSRRRRATLVAAASVVAIAVTSGLLPGVSDVLRENGDGSVSADGWGWFSARNAAAAELDSYVGAFGDDLSDERPVVPRGRYYYENVEISAWHLDAGDVPLGSHHRSEMWSGHRADDFRLLETTLPYEFRSETDRRRWIADRGTAKGMSGTATQETLPAQSPHQHPFHYSSARRIEALPPDAAGLAVAVEEELRTMWEQGYTKLMAEGETDAAQQFAGPVPANEVAKAMVGLIAEPAITPLQRVRLIGLLGRYPDAGWRSDGVVDVDGLPAVIFSTPTESREDSQRTEYVLTAEAPGLLARRDVLVEPEKYPALRMLEPGTVVHERKVTAWGVVKGTRQRP